MLPDTLAFVDVETTGGYPPRDRVIEIGILRVEKGKVVDAFESLINPQSYLPPEITMLTGITTQELDNAPTFWELSDKIHELLEGAVFVAHNARFDASFLKAEFGRLERPLSLKQLCTAKLSRRLFPRFRHHNLDSLIERFGIACEPRHRALPDAKVLWHFMKAIQKQFDMSAILEAYEYVTKAVSLPSAITQKTIDSLPEKPGVYQFYDGRGGLLYIGKSINIRDRVMSHFYEFASSRKDAKVYHAIASIVARETSGELGALLLESALIKEYQPLLNRQLRKSHRMIALIQSTTPEGYFTIERNDVSQIPIDDTTKILGVYRTEKQLKEKLCELSREHMLCNKLLGVEKTKGRCFGSHIEQCHGACIGGEMPARYNLRFSEAFYKTKIKQWPFGGPIVIKEGNDGHIVNHWRYMGKVSDSWPEDRGINSFLPFDYDTYKILSSHLLKSRSRVSVIPLEASYITNSPSL